MERVRSEVMRVQHLPVGEADKGWQRRGLVFGQPKSARGRRRIALSDGVLELLKAHKAKQNAGRLMLGPAWQDNDLVFCTPQGTPIDPGNLYHAFLRTCDAAGVRRIPFHGLRHTHATLLLLQNIPAKVVSERLVHAGVAITMDLYSHVLPGMQEDAARQLDELLTVRHDSAHG
ncbi:MAG: site-specific integrase [Chloroflexota bacterium]|nr:MAG: site-specific integrase [Chloroflexota bacterium]